MGNPLSADASQRVRLFASSHSWIEDAAIRQLEQLADRNGMKTVVGMPDLHPGYHGPVGCAALSDNIVHPDIVGTDIGCGMQLWALELPERRLKLDKATERLTALEGPWAGDREALLAEHDIAAGPFGEHVGTIGGGNHFCEVQAVADILDDDAAGKAGIVKGGVFLLVHSGSRGLGAETLARHHAGGREGLALDKGGHDYLDDHDTALRFAMLNRRIIASRAIEALRTDGIEMVDAPHNFVERQGTAILHRKGAAASNRPLIPIPGSRGAATYLVEPAPDNAEAALFSLAHGAGRKHDRASMEKRVRTQPGSLEKLARTSYGGRVICTDRKLLVEEAPEAYKDIRRVVADLETHGLARTVAILRPLITFKTARGPSHLGGRVQD